MMRWWEILLIIQGYRRRNVLQYQLQRIQAWASAFCMGNPEHKQPEDLVPLYFDNYKEQYDSPLTDEEKAELEEDMRNFKF